MHPWVAAQSQQASAEPLRDGGRLSDDPSGIQITATRGGKASCASTSRDRPRRRGLGQVVDPAPLQSLPERHWGKASRTELAGM